MLKILSLAGGLAGAVGLSQVPEFSQQYVQRLAGQVDALTVVVVDFDRSALASGLGREEALQQMTGSAFLEDRQADMRRTFARHARLSDNLAELRAASPLARMAMPHRLADAETLSATWGDYAPAVPANAAGLLAGGLGFFGGWAVFGAAFAALRWPFRRAAALPKGGDVTRRKDPIVAHPKLMAERPAYKPVMGETR